MITPTAWPAETVWQQVFPLPPDFTVEVLPEIDSSNSELMRRARAGQHEATLLVAERQTAGRGRMGRVWQSQPGDSLTFSLSLALKPQDWSGLSLAVGLSLAESLHPNVGLKWPNDLWFQDRKLGGILVEAASMGGRSQVVIGVGLNIRSRSADGLNTAPAALSTGVAVVGVAGIGSPVVSLFLIVNSALPKASVVAVQSAWSASFAAAVLAAALVVALVTSDTLALEPEYALPTCSFRVSPASGLPLSSFTL